MGIKRGRVALYRNLSAPDIEIAGPYVNAIILSLIAIASLRSEHAAFNIDFVINAVQVETVALVILVAGRTASGRDRSAFQFEFFRPNSGTHIMILRLTAVSLSADGRNRAAFYDELAGKYAAAIGWPINRLDIAAGNIQAAVAANGKTPILNIDSIAVARTTWSCDLIIAFQFDAKIAFSFNSFIRFLPQSNPSIIQEQSLAIPHNIVGILVRTFDRHIAVIISPGISGGIGTS